MCYIIFLKNGVYVKYFASTPADVSEVMNVR